MSRISKLLEDVIVHSKEDAKKWYEKYNNLYSKVNTHIEDMSKEDQTYFARFEDSIKNGFADFMDYETEYNDLNNFFKKEGR